MSVDAYLYPIEGVVWICQWLIETSVVRFWLKRQPFRFLDGIFFDSAFEDFHYHHDFSVSRTPPRKIPLSNVDPVLHLLRLVQTRTIFRDG